MRSENDLWAWQYGTLIFALKVNRLKTISLIIQYDSLALYGRLYGNWSNLLQISNVQMEKRNFIHRKKSAVNTIKIMPTILMSWLKLISWAFE